MTHKRWSLTRTRQCALCPWLTTTTPTDIPGEYCLAKHKHLQSTIAEPGSLANDGTLRIMACHEHHTSHCIGWLHNQLTTGNNIPLRLEMLSCDNADKITLIGEQHPHFQDTLPSEETDPGIKAQR